MGKNYINYNKLRHEMMFGNNHMFILGNGGSGKTELALRIIEEEIFDKIDGYIRVAPSGIAALRIMGYTIHNLFKLLPTVQTKDNWRRVSMEVNYLIKNIKILLIDEISMVRADVLDQMDYILRTIKNCNEPFGGVKVIMMGDIFQLPYVDDSSEYDSLNALYPYSKGKYYFFNSNVYLNSAFQNKLNYYELKFNFRQNKDLIFSEINNRIRMGQHTKQDLDALNTRVYPFLEEYDYHYLTLTKKQANFINENRLSQLPDDLITSKAFFNYYNHTRFYDIKDSLPMEVTLPIKIGSKIMFNMNDQSGEKKYFNGTIGIITDKIFDGERLTRVVVKIKKDYNTYQEFEVERLNCNIYKSVYDFKEKKIITKISATMYQFPFKVSFANTIHKTQSLTLSNIILNLENRVFASGQLYVGLSRVPSLENIYLIRRIENSDIIVCPVIMDFYKSVFLPNYIPVYFDLNDAKSTISEYNKKDKYDKELIERVHRMFCNGLNDDYIKNAVAEHPDFLYKM